MTLRPRRTSISASSAELFKRAEDRDRTRLWTLCPRPVCDKGYVFETVDGIRKPPPYVCPVCHGDQVVPVGPRDWSGQQHVTDCPVCAYPKENT